jgi:predicted nucleotidyltransferase component of viral defense system
MNIFDQMMSRYEIKSDSDRLNALHEIMQEITLAGLYRSGFFEKAAFYGGTCLRIFHNLPRFSEDLDFSLVAEGEPFQIEDYFPAIVSEFKMLGRDVELSKKLKSGFGKVESAFLKDQTDLYDLSLKSDKKVRIKIEVDTNPPLNFDTEQKLLLQPFSFMTRCFTLSDLYAGKMHALVYRARQNRVKGRDWYDFEWYVRNEVPLNFNHLQVRIKEFNGLEMNKETFQSILKERLASTDIEKVKRDVAPFLKNTKELDIWSNDYFLLLSDRIRYQ